MWRLCDAVHHARQGYVTSEIQAGGDAVHCGREYAGCRDVQSILTAVVGAVQQGYEAVDAVQYTRGGGVQQFAVAVGDVHGSDAVRSEDHDMNRECDAKYAGGDAVQQGIVTVGHIPGGDSGCEADNVQTTRGYAVQPYCQAGDAAKPDTAMVTTGGDEIQLRMTDDDQRLDTEYMGYLEMSTRLAVDKMQPGGSKGGAEMILEPGSSKEDIAINHTQCRPQLLHSLGLYSQLCPGTMSSN